MAGAARRSQPFGHASASSADNPLATAVEEFGLTVSQKLGRGGTAEDQLRGPVEQLLRCAGALVGLETIAYGEVGLKDLRARPDYAVDVGDCRIGYIELKAPDRGVPPNWKHDPRDHKQWLKLQALPNLLYTDGISWRRYSYGEPAGPVVRLSGSLTHYKEPVRPSDHQFDVLLRDFLLWEPEQPRTLSELIKIVAGLCRLLRDEVIAILSSTPQHAAYEDLTLLAEDWRDLLFPDLDDRNFSDAYAQTITSRSCWPESMALASTRRHCMRSPEQLGKKHSLIGKALAVLTDSDTNRRASHHRDPAAGYRGCRLEPSR